MAERRYPCRGLAVPLVRKCGIFSTEYSEEAFSTNPNKVYGWAGSYAETFCKEHGIEFVAVNKRPDSLENIDIRGLSVSPTNLKLNVGESNAILATIKPEGSGVASWSSSDANVATVSANGTVTAKAEGSATITARAGDLSATCAVTVEKVQADDALNSYYQNELNQWISDNITYKGMLYLTNNANFPNSRLVHNWDSDKSQQVVGTVSNAFYGGVDGWKELFTKSTSEEKAREILVAILNCNEEESKDIARAKVADRYAGLVSKAMDLMLKKKAANYGLKSEDIKEIKDYFSNNEIKLQLINGNFEDIINNIDKHWTFVPANITNIKKCVQDFAKSQELCDAVSNGMDIFGKGVNLISISASTIQRIYETESLLEVDNEYLEITEMIANKCPYDPVKRAAGEVAGVIRGGVNEARTYVLQDVSNEAIDLTIGEGAEALTEFMDAIPYGKIIKESYKLGSGSIQ